jgi:diacylglycerol O-acyltransferase
MAQAAKSPDAAAWGGPQDMSAWEALMWRAEADQRTSSTGILLEILDGEPDWSRFVAAHQRTVERIPRLRERVVEPPLPVVQPAWSAVPGFDVHDHLHLVPLAPGPDADRRLIEFCELTMQRPLDPARPPWEGILVTGLEEGRAAYLFRFHHSLTDGLGLVQLLAIAHSGTAEQPRKSTKSAALPARIERPVVTPGSLLQSRLTQRLLDAPMQVSHQVKRALDTVTHVATRPAQALAEGARFTSSLRRMLAGPPAPGSPLLSERTLGNRFLTLDVSLDELKRSAKSAGGSVNDAFVAAVLGGIRVYHERHGVMVDTIPIAMPVSLRTENDPLGGNRFAGARFAAPLAEPDPVERIRIIRTFVLEARDEPAISFLDHLSPTLTKLPTSAIIELTASLMASSDLQISNIRGLSEPVYLAGREVLRTYPLGPRPGVAAMVAMITYDGTCCLGLNVDPQVFPDVDLLQQCLAEGFAEVLAVATPGDPA